MNVDRRDHHHGNKRPYSAASLCNVETPVAGNRIDARANRINRHSEQPAQCANDINNQKLQPESRLLDRAQRSHEKKQSYREKKDTRHLFAPEKKNRSERDKRKPKDRDTRLQGACPDHVTKNSNSDKNQSEVVSLFRRLANFTAVIPDEKQDDRRDQFTVLLIVLRQKTHPGPCPNRLGAIRVERKKTKKVNDGRKRSSEQKRLKWIPAR